MKKKSFVGLVALPVLLLTMRLALAQEAPSVNGDQPQMGNEGEIYNADAVPMPDQQNNADEVYVPVNSDTNSDVTNMPFIPSDNADKPAAPAGE